MRKQLTICTFVALLLGQATTTQAQAVVTFGPRLGGNLATATFNSLEEIAGTGISYSYSRSPILAPQIGMALNLQWGQWAFQPALLFSQKGLRQKASLNADFFGVPVRDDLDVTSRINYLELPLHVVYTPGEDHGIQFFAGPYLAVGVGGKADLTETLTSLDPNHPESYSESGSLGYEFGGTFAEPDNSGTNTTSGIAQARRFDAGVSAGVGYRFGPVQAQLGYSLGLLNAQPDYPASYQMRNTTGYHRVLQLTATYFLKPR